MKPTLCSTGQHSNLQNLKTALICRFQGQMTVLRIPFEARLIYPDVDTYTRELIETTVVRAPLDQVTISGCR
jgi:hypothetical protein